MKAFEASIQEQIRTGGLAEPLDYVSTRAWTVSTSPIAVADRSPKATYRLLQVTGGVAVEIFLAEAPPQAGDKGIVLNPGDAYEMTAIFGNLYAGKIWAKRAGASDTEVRVTEIGRHGS